MTESNSRSKNGRSEATATAAAETALAETAGKDTWQTWAGRKHGTDDFEVLDVFRGIKRSLHHNLGTKVPKAGTLCPICFCDPNEGVTSATASSSNWHVTWCGHAVCKECLGRYAASQVQDREQSGPLTCPVCLKTLRKQDAVVAMMAGKQFANERDILQQWDTKMRNQLLRAIPSFRSCPKCGGSNNANSNSSGEGVGGGFVTPECLGPHHQERREQAIQILLQRNYAYAGILGAYLMFVAHIAQNKSSSPYLDLWSMLLPIYVFVKLGMAVNVLLARYARSALFRSISVGCPCCQEDFVLPAESENFVEEETQKWVSTNTRPCPSCSVPISKTGGCNHMRCSHCGANFCWACMRLQTACRAYRCQHGARFGNATLFEEVEDGGRAQALHRDGSVLTYIDHILNHRTCPELSYMTDGGLLLACLWARHFSWVQFLERTLLAPPIRLLVRNAEPVVCLAILPLFIWATPLGLDRDQLLLVAVVSLNSFPFGIGLALAHFVLRVLPRLREGRGLVEPAPIPARDRAQALDVPEEPRDIGIVDALEQTMINEALRRSIDDT